MNPIFEYKKRFKYTHMSEADKIIWERFIEKYPNAYNSVQYDFRVGDPPPFNPMGENGEDLNQDALYRLRIDVVAKMAGNFDIIEIKPKAGPSTIGQVKGYKSLFLRDEKPTGQVRALIITDQKMPNMEFIANKEGIVLIVV